MKRISSLFLFALFWLAASVPIANGGLTYTLRFDSTNYSPLAGSTFQAELYIDEFWDGNGLSTRLGSDVGGYISAGIKATLAGSGAAFSADPIYGPGFDSPANGRAFTPNTAELQPQLVDFGGAGITGSLDGMTTTASLGFMIMSAGAAGSSATITPDQFGALDDILIEDSSFNLFVVEDDPSFSVVASTISPVAVPEPNCAVVCSIALCWLTGRRKLCTTKKTRRIPFKAARV